MKCIGQLKTLCQITGLDIKRPIGLLDVLSSREKSFAKVGCFLRLSHSPRASSFRLRVPRTTFFYSRAYCGRGCYFNTVQHSQHSVLGLLSHGFAQPQHSLPP